MNGPSEAERLLHRIITAARSSGVTKLYTAPVDYFNPDAGRVPNDKYDLGASLLDAEAYFAELNKGV